MSVRSSKLYLYSDDKTSDAFQVLASANEVNLSYAGKPVKFSAPIQYQDGVVYHTLTTKFAEVVSSVVSETSRAISAESLLNGLIVSEASTARAAEAKLASDLSAEATLRSTTDTSFNQAMAAETLARQSADVLNATNINIEKNRAEAYEASLNIMINTEVTRALGIEAKLRTDLDTEIADRKSAISTEQKVRSDADIALGVRIDNEITRATGSEVSNFQLLDGYISSEAKARADADVLLNTRINFLTLNTDQSKLDSLSEIVNRMNATGSDIYARLSLLEDIVGSLRNQALYATPKPAYVADVPASL